jgi:hypothetical protein
MDTPSQDSSNAPLDSNSAADAFANLMSPPEVAEKSAEALEAEALDELTKPNKAEPEADPVDPDASALDDEKVTVEIDGKMIELTKAQIAESHKNGLRQADYTQKTMAVAEARKTAEAETAKAHSERNQYAQALQRNAMQLEAALEQQSRIDMDALIANDPVEAMKQQLLFQKRQAAYQETQQQLNAVNQQVQAEQQEQTRNFQAAQQQELLAKLPQWKDPAKAAAESSAIRSYLKETGFDDASLNNINDHRAVLMARKAMLYDQMMSKATAAAKKVQALPQKVVRPGVGDSPQLDGRSAVMQRLNKTGSMSDAAAAFASIL